MLLILVFSLTVLTALGENSVNPNTQETNIQGGLFIGRGRTKRFVQLDGKQKNEVYEACELPDGKPGLCKPPNLCLKKENEGNMIMFADNLCVRGDNRKVGLCCPPSIDEAIADGVAGDLPAVAAVDEDVGELTRMTSGVRTRGCGVSTRAQGRVTGSGPANPREWPWMVSVTTTYSEPHCGGSLITDIHVMTAGHCVYEIEKEDLKVRLGEYDFKRQNDTRSYNFEVAEIRLHEEFDINNLKNDIALLKLHKPATFNTYVWPICLPPLGLNIVNQTAYLIGWGTQSIGGPHSNVLLEVAIPIWDLDNCADSVTEATEENICAGAYEGGKDACQHDSGGPLMYQMSSGRWTVIGIVSWGVRCGEAEHPGLYTKVEAYLPWIVANAQF